MSSAELVDERIAEDKVFEGRAFPLTWVPAGSARPFAAERLAGWLREHRQQVLHRAMEHGAVLLRGFAVDSALDFDAVVGALGLEEMPYIGGAAVRQVITPRVFTANESPPSEPIPFHHEMAQVPNPPDYVLFYCEVPATAGGATPIVLSNEIYRFTREHYPAFLERMERLGVRYVRVLPEEDDASSAIGRSWKSTYQVKTREEAEARMRELGTEWEWLEGGNLRTVTATIPAIRQEPRTGKKTFFNSMIAAYTGWVDSRNDPKKAVCMGDGSPVDDEAMDAIAAYMQQACVAFKWEKGDVLLVDNRLTMHSRQPFTPPRRILASVMRAPRA